MIGKKVKVMGDDNIFTILDKFRGADYVMRYPPKQAQELSIDLDSSQNTALIETDLYLASFRFVNEHEEAELRCATINPRTIIQIMN